MRYNSHSVKTAQRQVDLMVADREGYFIRFSLGELADMCHRSKSWLRGQLRLRGISYRAERRRLLLKYTREQLAKGVQQKQVAATLGLNQNTIHLILKGDDRDERTG